MSVELRLPFQKAHPTSAPVVYSPREADWIEAMPGERMLYRIRSSEVAGKYAVVEAIFAPNCGSPLHLHAEDEVYQVLSGTMTFLLGGELISAPTGTTVVVPAGTPHAVKNRTNAPVRTLTTFTPGGVEAMFEKLPGLDAKDVVKVAATYGTIVLGPPLD